MFTVLRVLDGFGVSWLGVFRVLSLGLLGFSGFRVLGLRDV